MFLFRGYGGLKDRLDELACHFAGQRLPAFAIYFIRAGSCGDIRSVKPAVQAHVLVLILL